MGRVSREVRARAGSARTWGRLMTWGLLALHVWTERYGDVQGAWAPWTASAAMALVCFRHVWAALFARR